MDQSPTEVYATLLHDEVYHCSAPTMYRVLAQPPLTPYLGTERILSNKEDRT